MRNYPVLITEMLQVTVSVKADCAAEAVAKVKEHWGRGDILLDADQFTGVEISAVDGESTIMLHRDCDGNEYLERGLSRDEGSQAVQMRVLRHALR